LRRAARSTWRIAAFTSCTAAGERKLYIERVASVPLHIIDDLGMRKLPATAAEDLLEIEMRRYERTPTMLTGHEQGRSSSIDPDRC
jgi:DNA replication protein DnaC